MLYTHALHARPLRLGLLATLAVLFTGCSGDKGGVTEPPESSGTPSRGTATYDIQIQGTTFAGNTNFPSAETQFSPVENFSRTGTLIIAPSVNGSDDGDVAIFSGRIGEESAGALWFATNSKLFGAIPAVSQSVVDAAIDVATVRIENGTVTVAMDDNSTGQPTGRTVQLNSFVWRSGLAAPKQILLGQMQLTLANGGSEVSGDAAFIGGGYIEPGTYAIRVAFTGRRRG